MRKLVASRMVGTVHFEIVQRMTAPRQGDLFGNEGPDPSDDAFETPVYYPNPNTVTRGTAPDFRRGARGQDDPLGREPHGALSRYLPADDGVSAGR